MLIILAFYTFIVCSYIDTYIVTYPTYVYKIIITPMAVSRDQTKIQCVRFQMKSYLKRSMASKVSKMPSMLIHDTLGKISILRAVSVCNETTLINGSVGGAGEWSHTCTLGTFLLCPLAQSMPICINFKINGASEETKYLLKRLFCTV